MQGQLRCLIDFFMPFKKIVSLRAGVGAPTMPFSNGRTMGVGKRGKDGRDEGVTERGRWCQRGLGTNFAAEDREDMHEKPRQGAGYPWHGGPG